MNTGFERKIFIWWFDFTIKEISPPSLNHLLGNSFWFLSSVSRFPHFSYWEIVDSPRISFHLASVYKWAVKIFPGIDFSSDNSNIYCSTTLRVSVIDKCEVVITCNQMTQMPQMRFIVDEKTGIFRFMISKTLNRKNCLKCFKGMQGWLDSASYFLMCAYKNLLQKISLAKLSWLCASLNFKLWKSNQVSFDWRKKQMFDKE